MTIIKHELKQGRLAFIIWTAVICFFFVVAIIMYPQMKGEMDKMGEMFSSMGAFSDAFGMDKLDFGTLTGYYITECGNTLGLAGAFFAAVCAAGMLSKEEHNKTAEFLFTHPVGRCTVITQKLLSVFIQIIALNVFVFAASSLSVIAIGEKLPVKELLLVHTAYLIMQIEIAGISFGLSAVMRKGSAGAGIGIAAVMYFMNIIANITDKVSFLKYITAYGYCDGADIIADMNFDWVKIAIGMGLCLAGILSAYTHYVKKDIKI